jgi:hypothetical protein
MVLPKYAVALLQFLTLLATALSVSLQDGFDNVEIAQFVAIAAGAGVTFFVPLVSGPWSGALKTGFSVVAAVATAAVPFIVNGSITSDQIMIVVLAALNAVMSEVGISIRKAALNSELLDAGTALAGTPVDITSVTTVPQSVVDPEGMHALGR